ncbi:ZP domain-containing protein-like isoform X2 [Aquarana catesbeiana]|uniref:ZP domain-containing protein-like isoform X2 n=1 Tax=Aquarana catesbeiana TaxID=8400 RepID=UPI003CC9C4BD
MTSEDSATMACLLCFYMSELNAQMAEWEVLILCVSIITAALVPHMQGGPVSVRPHEELSNGRMVEKQETHDALLATINGITNVNQISTLLHTQRKTYMYTETGFGVFTFTFQFFTDKHFVNSRQNLSAVQRGERLYLEIQVSSPVPDIELFVESCKATPHDDPSGPVFYSIIQDGCIKDQSLVTYPGSANVFRFSIEAPSIFQIYKQVFISSSVILCKKMTPNTRCTEGCTVNPYRNHRRRRSLVNETQPHVISQGPIHMKDVTVDISANVMESSSGSKTTVVAISVSVTGVVATSLEKQQYVPCM